MYKTEIALKVVMSSFFLILHNNFIHIYLKMSSTFVILKLFLIALKIIKKCANILYLLLFMNFIKYYDLFIVSCSLIFLL